MSGERGLRFGSSDAAFAASMLKCQHAGAFCAADGYCHLQGRCFSNARPKGETDQRLDALEAKIDRLLAKERPHER